LSNDKRPTDDKSRPLLMESRLSNVDCCANDAEKMNEKTMAKIKRIPPTTPSTVIL
jgi:hypothetical protein